MIPEGVEQRRGRIIRQSYDVRDTRRRECSKRLVQCGQGYRPAVGSIEAGPEVCRAVIQHASRPTPIMAPVSATCATNASPHKEELSVRIVMPAEVFWHRVCG